MVKMIDMQKPSDENKDYERLLKARAATRYVLRLYVAGMASRSLQAIENVKEICEEYLKGRVDLKVIDIYLHPELAESSQIIAAPTLIKQRPLPMRRLVGNLSN